MSTYGVASFVRVHALHGGRVQQRGRLCAYWGLLHLNVSHHARSLADMSSQVTMAQSNGHLEPPGGVDDIRNALQQAGIDGQPGVAAPRP
jgi:hypothetical protein